MYFTLMDGRALLVLLAYCWTTFKAFNNNIFSDRYRRYLSSLSIQDAMLSQR